MFERFFGASEANIIGKTDYDFVDKTQADYFREHDRKAMVAGKPTSEEEWISFADNGLHVFMNTIKTPMYDPQGALIGVLGIGRDITERKRIEEEIHESEEKFRIVFENLFDGISIYYEDPDPSKRKLFECNEQYAALAGRSRNELLQLGITQELQIVLEDKESGNRLETLDRRTAYREVLSRGFGRMERKMLLNIGVCQSHGGGSHTP